MPNKEKSVKAVPKSNGNDAIQTQSTIDVMSTDVKKGTNNKKREKHKNKDICKANNNTNVVNVTAKGLNATSTNDQIDPEIRAVGEELLRRLQCNGTSISVRKTENAADISTQQISAIHGDNSVRNVSLEKSKPQQQLKQLNNNNNNSKAHNKNCHNQNQSAKSVNISSNNVEISSETVKCNRTHSASLAPSVENHTMTCPGTSKNSNHEVSVSQISSEQIQAAMTSKEIAHEPTTSQSQYHTNLPSTSTMMPSECTLSSLPRSVLSVKSINMPNIEVTFKEYENELQMPDIMRVIQRELSEPYSIYTYRYFIHNWPKLCFLAMDGDSCIGAIVCKLDIHRQMTKRGYIAMLAVDAAYRKFKVGTTLVQKAIEVRFIVFFFR